jgi:hypothetical protein
MPAFALPDSITDRLRHAADQGELAWRDVARLTEACLERAADVPRMTVYQSIAYEAGSALSTIRLYHQMEMRYGELLDECPMVRLTHLRIATNIANAENTTVAAVIARQLKESDEWGGKLIPPDVWKASLRLRSEGKVPNPYLAALERAERNLSTALRHASAQNQAALIKMLTEVRGIK